MGCLLEKRSFAHHVSIYSVWLRYTFHCFVMTAVFILYVIGVYSSFQNYPNFLNQSCHSYAVHLHDEEIVLEGKTLFYKPKKMVVTKSVECTPSLNPKVLNQFVDSKGLFLGPKRD